MLNENEQRLPPQASCALTTVQLFRGWINRCKRDRLRFQCHMDIAMNLRIELSQNPTEERRLAILKPWRA